MKMKSSIAALTAAALALAMAPAASAKEDFIEFCHTVNEKDMIGESLHDLLPIRYAPDKGWVFSARDFRMDYEFDAQTYDQYLRLSHDFIKRGIELAILVPPPRPLLLTETELLWLNGPYLEYSPHKARRSYDRLIEQLQAGGAHAPNLLDYISANPELRDQFFFKRDTHWQPSGAEAAMLALATSAPDTSIFHKPDAAPSFFEDGATEDVQIGRFGALVNSACATDVPRESYKRSTVSLANAGGADDLSALLFGAAPEPEKAEIALVGTSFTNRRMIDVYGVTDAARLHLQREVINFGVEGGGLVASLVAMMNSPEFQSDQIKGVIWEIPSTAAINDTGKWLQAVGRFHHSCKKFSAKIAVPVGDSRDVEVAFPVRHFFADPNIQSISFNLPQTYFGPAALMLKYSDGVTVQQNLTNIARIPDELRDEWWTTALFQRRGVYLTDIALKTEYSFTEPWMDMEFCLDEAEANTQLVKADLPDQCFEFSTQFASLSISGDFTRRLVLR